MIIKSAEPFFFPGDSTGCLLVHGFTGTPNEMRWLGKHLAAQGHTVLGVRLFGHATTPEDMLRARWQDWMHSVEDGWHLLRSTCDQVFVMGLSLGGVLSLIFASQFPVSGVVTMSTPYALRQDPRLQYVKLLAPIMPRLPKGPPDWRDLETARDHVDYPYYPTRALAELRDVVSELDPALPKVTAPVLLIHARGDTGGGSFDADSMPKLYDRLGTPDKQMLWIEDSGHVITRDPQKLRVFEAAASFVDRVSRQGAGPREPGRAGGAGRPA